MDFEINIRLLAWKVNGQGVQNGTKLIVTQ